MKTYRLIGANCQTFVFEMINSIGNDSIPDLEYPPRPEWYSNPHGRLTSLHAFVASDLPVLCVAMSAMVFVLAARYWWNFTADHTCAWSGRLLGFSSMIVLLHMRQYENSLDVRMVIGTQVIRGSALQFWVHTLIRIVLTLHGLAIMPWMPGSYYRVVAPNFQLTATFI